MLRQAASSPTSFTGASDTIAGATIDRLCTLLRQWCGVQLNESKMYLIRNRLAQLRRDYPNQTVEQLLDRAAEPRGLVIRERLVDALTTHETLFFRDISPFAALTDQIIPQIRQRVRNAPPRLRIWSAACSTGQEPYSIAISLLEKVPDIARWSVEILATDVGTETVAQAKNGSYFEHEVRRGLAPELQQRYFTRQGNTCTIVERVRRMIRFEVGNLLGANLPGGPFDMIFCRNVLIYFSNEDSRRVLESVTKRLTPEGYLFVGSSEVLGNASDLLQVKRLNRATAYQRR